MAQSVLHSLGGSRARVLALACSVGTALLSVVCLLRLMHRGVGVLGTRAYYCYDLQHSGEWCVGRDTAAGNEAYVSVRTGSDITGTGSMTAPFATIGLAISETYTGGTIHVAQGVYTENLRLEKALNLLGGYDAVRWNTRSLAPYLTIVDGGNQGCVLEIEADGEQGSLIEGFTIVHGHHENGGGVYLAGSAPVTLSTNWILSNTADENGGGICVGESSRVVIMHSNSVLHNKAERAGGGIAIACGVVTAQNDIIADNESASSGAGVDVLSGALTARHWTLAHNGYFAVRIGNGNGSAILTNTIVAFHDVAGFSGLGIIADHTLSDRSNHCLVGALCTHNVTGMPNYLNPPAGDYHIGAGSAALDAAENVGVTTDVDGDPRPACSGYDIGADELIPPAPTARFASSSPGLVNRPVAFTNTTTIIGCASYVWSFGDRLTSTLTSPTHTYTSPGLYTVTLTATNGAGTDVFTDTVTIHSPPTRVVIAGTPTGVINANYTLAATVIPPTATLPITYNWRSDGFSQMHVVSNTVDTASFAWGTLGSRSVIVTATNAGGTVSRAHVITITAAQFPFHDDFRSGILGGGWSVITDNQGRVQVSDNYEPPTSSSNYTVLLDDGARDQIYSTASLMLTIDLAADSGVVLDFWWRSFGDEPHPQDGVFISDDYGITWYPIHSFNSGPGVFRQEYVYLDTEIARYGLCFNDHFQIKFQFYDNWPIEEDGYAIADVWVRSAPVEHVALSGRSMGNVNTDYPFTAVASPPTATLPITFTWAATDQVTKVQLSDDDVTDTTTFAWNTPGMNAITVTASNVAGAASGNYMINVAVWPDSVRIAGPTSGLVGQSQNFTAGVSPTTSSMPITYTWEATDRPTRARLGGITDTIALAWNTAGMKVITVTAVNAGGIASATHALSIGVPVEDVDIAGPRTGRVNTAYLFTATVSPPTAALPITYQWIPPPLAGQGSPVVTYHWSCTGLQTITVKAMNSGGMATRSHTVMIDLHRLYMPLALRDYCEPGRWCSQNDQNLSGKKTVFALVGCDNGTLFAGTDDGIYRRASGSIQWQREMSVSGSEEVRSLAAGPDCTLVYAAVLNRGFFRRENNAWHQVTGSGEDMNKARAVALSGDMVLVGGDFGVRYADAVNADSWKIAELCSDLGVVNLTESLGQIYAAVWGGGICYCDEDDLDHWSSRNECLQTEYYDSLHARYVVGSGGTPALLGTNTGFYQWDPGKQCDQNSGGWDRKGQTPTFWFVVNDTTIYAAQEDGIVRSTDGGKTWFQMNDGWVPPPSIVYTLLMQTGEEGQYWLYAGTSQGVWRHLLP